MLTVNFEKLSLESGDRILDLGCGEGRHVVDAFCRANVTAVGVDLSFTDAQKTKDNFEIFGSSEDCKGETSAIIVANALELPFEDHYFDHIICSEVLEHIPDYEGALKEIFRILKPGGNLVISVPRYWPEKVCWMLSDEYHANEGGHIRIFKAKQLKQQIQKLGFKYWNSHWAHALHSPYWWLKCLFWKKQERSLLVKAYHQILVWDILKQPRTTRIAEKILNPVIGKSVVFYFTKELRDSA